MPKNIVLLSDGTANSSASLLKTNVWRLYQALDLTDPAKQIGFYDDGVGSSSNKYIAAVTGIFGFGLKRNVIDIYRFLCRNYEPGDDIYGFGFSRGSFTMRVVAGLIAREGIIQAGTHTEAELYGKAVRAYRRYRSHFHTASHVEKPFRWLRDLILGRGVPVTDERWKPDIHFLGLWDTVDAYGGPIDEIVRAIDYWIWPLSMPDHFMSRKIKRACHALSLEDERDAFKPVLWDERYVKDLAGNLHPMIPAKREGGRDDGDPENKWEPPSPPHGKALADIDKERLSQVWFVGVHRDVGGGYPQDGLAYFTLDWMIERAKIYKLELLDVQATWLRSLINPLDKLNDSRSGFSAYYRYKPRRLEDIYKLPPYKPSVCQDWRNIKRLWRKQPDPEDEVRKYLAPDVPLLPRPAPKIHEGVFHRIDKGVDGYVPIVLPKDYRIVTKAGDIGSSGLTKDQADWRAWRQEEVWDLVWKRRIVYFLTMFSLLFIAIMPLLQGCKPGYGTASPVEFLIPFINMLASRLPEFVSPWFDAFKAGPERLLAGLIAVVWFMTCGTTLQGRIRDTMRPIMRLRDVPASPPRGGVYAVRTSGPYRAIFYWLTHELLPSLFAGAIVLLFIYALIVLGSRLLFPSAVILGQVCEPTVGITTAVTDAAPVTAQAPFLTKNVCQATGLTVEGGRRYSITLRVAKAEPWADHVRPSFFRRIVERFGSFEIVKSAASHGPARIARWLEKRDLTRISTTPMGFGWHETVSPLTYRLPFRRYASVNWFQPIVRVGHRGFDEKPLTFSRATPEECVVQPESDCYVATFEMPRSGEVFLYVNDVVSGYGGTASQYVDNAGKAIVTLKTLPKPDPSLAPK